MAQNSEKKPIIAEPEIMYVEGGKVICDGGVGALGHPRVYLQMDEKGKVECPYCDKKFIKTGGPSDNR